MGRGEGASVPFVAKMDAKDEGGVDVGDRETQGG